MSDVSEDVTRFEHGREGQLAGTPFEGRSRFRTFGSAGPMYEVLSMGDHSVRILLFNSDEEAEYRLDRALTDPVAE